MPNDKNRRDVTWTFNVRIVGLILVIVGMFISMLEEGYGNIEFLLIGFGIVIFMLSFCTGRGSDVK